MHSLIEQESIVIRRSAPGDGSASFADPFVKTAEVVALLELRAAQLGLAKRGRRWALAR